MEIKLKLDLEEIKEKIFEDILEDDDNLDYICDMIAEYMAKHITDNDYRLCQKIKNTLINNVFKKECDNLLRSSVLQEIKEKFEPFFEEDIKNFEKELEDKLKKIKELIKKE